MRSASVLLFLLGLCAGLRAEETVVANRTTAVAALTDDQFKDIFLGKKITWDDGSQVVVVVTKEGAGFDALMRRLGKNAQQFHTRWKKLVFTGRAAMPEQVGSDDELIELVARTPGAIGLVDTPRLVDGIKVVTVQ